MTMPGDDAVDVEDLRLDDRVTADERDLEAPPEDAYEQATPADPRELGASPTERLEVNEYDAVEQAAVVDPDDGYER